MTSADTLGARVPTRDALHASQQPRAVIAFLVLTFSWTWGLWGIMSVGAAWPMTILIPLQLLSGIGPGFAAVVTICGFDGLAALRPWLRRCLRWRWAFGWYGLAFFGPPLIMLATLALNALTGGITPASPAAGHIGLAMLQFVLVLFVGGPVGEEFGWRGYLLPALAPWFGWRIASVIIGAIWALWHVPLFYMAGTAQSHMPMALFTASSVALSVIFCRLSVNTAFSVIPALVLHWSINAWSWVIPVTPQGGVMQPYYLVMGLLFCIAIAVFFKPGPQGTAAPSGRTRNWPGAGQ
jgi:uncharacterized protein